MANQDELYLTPEGAEELSKELAELEGQGRDEMAARLRHAVSQGDLSENADYIKAKEDQAFLEGRIRELDIILKEATVVDRVQAGAGVQVGSSVVVEQEDKSERTFHIVGAKEADPSQGKISHQSPIGKALMGKTAGDTAVAETPGGTISMRIIELL